MDISTWFSTSGTYADGLTLYSQLTTCNANLLRSLSRENASNFLKLKYELKKALMSGSVTIVQKVENIVVEQPKELKDNSLIKEIIKQSEAVSFQKETMAMYPMELHSTYRQRVNDFYLACELKFQLNSLADGDENAALKIIIQLEDLWTKIDRSWMILDHWKDHNRIMPTVESEDISKLSGNKLVMMRNKLESRISKRDKTLESMHENVKSSPEDRGLLNLYNRKLEQLQQLKIDLETVRRKLKDE
ncbi:hypothetical protein [Flavobacterium sp. T12S277]|uniref:hypothetical protein n=1 Tax=Flavobacterium sp. T12S277 TaxID=3402752 RepID=UPI003AD9ABE1